MEPRTETIPAAGFVRVAGACGIAFGLLNPVSRAIAEIPPSPDSTPAELLAFFADNHARVLASFYLLTLNQCLLIVFSVGIWTVLRRAGAEGWGAVAFGAGLATAAVATAGNAFWGAAAFRADEGISPQTAATLFDLGNLFYTAWAPTALLLVATAVAALQTGALPRWLAMLALVDAVLLLLVGLPAATGGTRTPVVFGTFILFLVWAVGTGFAVMRASRGRAG